LAVSYLELLIKNGLVAKVDGEVVRYRIRPRGTDAPVALAGAGGADSGVSGCD